jgi:Phytanoyl-CoA dioxygenase (PhyH)
MTKLPILDASPLGYGADEPAMVEYRAAGTERALGLGNRGPLRFEADGRLAPEILESYSRHGFFVLEGVLDAAELDDIERDIAELLERAPTEPKGRTDRHGQPAIGVDVKYPVYKWVQPLTDPVGGTDATHGRYQAKMNEPPIPDGAPDHVVQLISGTLFLSEACLRLYGHPDLLRVAETINGPDFTPFKEAVWIKHPGLGGPVAWHQDGWTHWGSPELDAGTHGFNFMAQLYGCDAVNGLWVVPGSHATAQADIRKMVAEVGSDRLPEAVPLLCAPGDVAITNRQALHASFANTGPKMRVTINFGFHRRRSIIGVHDAEATYDEARVEERSKAIMYAIDARAQRYPLERRYCYQPFAGREDELRWNGRAQASLKDYNLLDLSI